MLDLLPHEKKLEVLSEHLNASQSEIKNLQIERSKMIVENQKLQYQLVKKYSKEHKRRESNLKQLDCLKWADLIGSNLPFSAFESFNLIG